MGDDHAKLINAIREKIMESKKNRTRQLHDLQVFLTEELGARQDGIDEVVEKMKSNVEHLQEDADSIAEMGSNARGARAANALRPDSRYHQFMAIGNTKAQRAVRHAHSVKLKSTCRRYEKLVNAAEGFHTMPTHLAAGISSQAHVLARFLVESTDMNAMQRVFNADPLNPNPVLNMPLSQLREQHVTEFLDELDGHLFDEAPHCEHSEGARYHFRFSARCLCFALFGANFLLLFAPVRFTVSNSPILAYLTDSPGSGFTMWFGWHCRTMKALWYLMSTGLRGSRSSAA